ncbi:hypothetical protein BJX96DRAFT_157102 [Aspergillus floccosus]
MMLEMEHDVACLDAETVFPRNPAVSNPNEDARYRLGLGTTESPFVLDDAVSETSDDATIPFADCGEDPKNGSRNSVAAPDHEERECLEQENPVEKSPRLRGPMQVSPQEANLTANNSAPIRKEAGYKTFTKTKTWVRPEGIRKSKRLQNQVKKAKGAKGAKMAKKAKKSTGGKTPRRQ